MTDFKRYDNEGILDYEFRICQHKDEIGTWQDVADLLNKTLGQEYTESKYRKQFQEMSKYTTMSETAQAAGVDIQELKEQRRLLEFEKIKMRDERNEVSRLYRQQARKESFEEMLQRCVESYTPVQLHGFRFEDDKGEDSTLLVPISDLHYGLNIDNSFNKYNTDVAIERLNKYATKVITIAKKHNSTIADIMLLGDEISGLIHSNLRLENNENVIQQTMDAAELISHFIYTLTPYFSRVNVYSVSGNHSRVQPNKELNAKGEDFDKFIPFYAKAKLQQCENVKFHENSIDESIISFSCRGKLVYGIHGDKDNLSNATQRLTMFTRQKPDIIYAGHLHTNRMYTEFDTKVIQSGCISGNDNYCLDSRISGKPEQAVAVITNEGLDCLYDISLN